MIRVDLAFNNPLKFWPANSLKSGSESCTASVFNIHQLLPHIKNVRVGLSAGQERGESALHPKSRLLVLEVA
jgi:hypothetical protein